MATAISAQENKIDMSPNTVQVEMGDTLTKVDTVHNDEAVKVFAQYHGDETWTEKEEQQVRRKIDRRLMPILCITYGLQYYDKSMLGQAVRCPHRILRPLPSC